ncbi:MAG: hypothetical protein ACHQE5_05485, partial [Actinomycetes bacterium]
MYSHLSAAVAVEQTDDHYHRAALSRRSRTARDARREEAALAERREPRARRTERVPLAQAAGES